MGMGIVFVAVVGIGGQRRCPQVQWCQQLLCGTLCGSALFEGLCGVVGSRIDAIQGSWGRWKH